MPTNTQTQAIVPPLFFGENELYDFIMGQIEPELTSAVIPTLREKYADETDEERAARSQKYDAAYAEYDKRFAEYVSFWTSQTRKNRKESIASVEQKNRAAEETDLSALEQSILTQ